MWSSAEMTVYFRSARGGSGRKVTVRGPSRPAVHSELASRSSIDNTGCSSTLVISRYLMVGAGLGGQRARLGGQLAFGYLAPGRAGKLVHHDQVLRIVLFGGFLPGQEVE